MKKELAVSSELFLKLCERIGTEGLQEDSRTKLSACEAATVRDEETSEQLETPVASELAPDADGGKDRKEGKKVVKKKQEKALNNKEQVGLSVSASSVATKESSQIKLSKNRRKNLRSIPSSTTLSLRSVPSATNLKPRVKKLRSITTKSLRSSDEKQTLVMVKKEVKENTCAICKRSFRSPLYIERHLAIHQREARVLCKTCSTYVPGRGLLKKHITTVHSTT